MILNLLTGFSETKPWLLDNYFPGLHKHYSTITNNFPSSGCLILTSFVVCMAFPFFFFFGTSNRWILIEALSFTLLSLVYALGRETPSVAGIINPGSEGFQKLFFGQEEIAIPVHSS